MEWAGVERSLTQRRKGAKKRGSQRWWQNNQPMTNQLQSLNLMVMWDLLAIEELVLVISFSFA